MRSLFSSCAGLERKEEALGNVRRWGGGRGVLVNINARSMGNPLIYHKEGGGGYYSSIGRPYRVNWHGERKGGGSR